MGSIKECVPWILLAVGFLTTLLSACRKDGEVLENMVSRKDGECRAILWEGRIYVPYTQIPNRERRRQLGIVDGDEQNQVYAWKEYPATQWLISFYHTGCMDSSMLMREITVTEIPEQLTSEYPWN